MDGKLCVLFHVKPFRALVIMVKLETKPLLFSGSFSEMVSLFNNRLDYMNHGAEFADRLFQAGREKGRQSSRPTRLKNKHQSHAGEQ